MEVGPVEVGSKVAPRFIAVAFAVASLPAAVVSCCLVVGADCVPVPRLGKCAALLAAARPIPPSISQVPDAAMLPPAAPRCENHSISSAPTNSRKKQASQNFNAHPTTHSRTAYCKKVMKWLSVMPSNLFKARLKPLQSTT